MTNYEQATAQETIDQKNEKFMRSTEEALNEVLSIVELESISVDDLSLEEATEIRKNLDPRFEGGEMKSRQLVNEQGVTNLPDDLAQIIFAYAEQNNMTNGSSELLPGSYDAVCSLGGANKAPYDRAKSLFEAVEEGHISTGLIVLSGSPRKISDAEKQKASSYAPGAETEADLAKGALQTLSEEYAELIEQRGLQLDILETSEGTYTTTEIEQLVDKYNLPEGSRVGLQTTQIYQPFTQLEASFVGLNKGVDIVVAGHASSEAVVSSRKPETYLSELTRALLSTVRLKQTKTQKS